MPAVSLEVARLTTGPWSFASFEIEEYQQDILAALLSEWPDMANFWEALSAHVTTCWQVVVGERHVPILAYALAEAVKAIERAETARSETLFGIFVNEVLFMISAGLAGHIAIADGQRRWTADMTQGFGEFLVSVDSATLTVLRQPASRQRRGEIAQALFWNLLPARVRAVLWPHVTQAMGPPHGRMA